MFKAKYQAKLPDAQHLARLCQQGLTYEAIGDLYGVPIWAVCYKLKKHSIFNSSQSSLDEVWFWQKASMALALIRYGHVTVEALRVRLDHRSKDTTYRLVNRLIGLDWVTKTPGKVATLHLIAQGKQMAPLITPVRRRPDGGMEVCRTSPKLAGQPIKCNAIDEERGV